MPIDSDLRLSKLNHISWASVHGCQKLILPKASIVLHSIAGLVFFFFFFAQFSIFRPLGCFQGFCYNQQHVSEHLWTFPSARLLRYIWITTPFPPGVWRSNVGFSLCVVERISPSSTIWWGINLQWMQCAPRHSNRGAKETLLLLIRIFSFKYMFISDAPLCTFWANQHQHFANDSSLPHLPCQTPN